MAYGRQALINLPNVEDHIQRVIYRSKQWYELDLLQDIFKRVRTGTAIDVGANIGTHTLFFAKICRLKTISFEPNRPIADVLEENIALNKLEQKVMVHRAAVGDETTKVMVTSGPTNNSGMVRCIKDDHGPVKMVRLDDIVLPSEDVTLIKIDVEGGEIGVLRGAEQLIKRCSPYIYAEAQTPEAKQELDDYMKALDYKPFGIFAKTPVIGYEPVNRPKRVAPVKAATAMTGTVRTATAPKLFEGRISAAIMAHPARAGMIPDLLKMLNSPAEVVLDRFNDRWETGRRSLLAYNPRCSHHLVIQDDTLPCENLIAILDKALDVVPATSPMALYTGRVGAFKKMVLNAVKGDTSWIQMPGLNWGPAVVIPTKGIPELVAFGDKLSLPNYDLRLSRFYESKKIDTWYPYPSLVEHRSSPSLVIGRAANRNALNYLANGADFNVHGGVVFVDLTR
jgi:FkbM family methyltransferase